MSKLRRSKIIVALSGGVDSAVTALLLKQQGHDIAAMFMKNWDDDDGQDYCPAAQDLSDAQAICTQLQIPLHTVNFAREYKERVFAYFLREYQAGRTPNPDVLCNKEIKFKAFLEKARTLGADLIATGHYARLHRSDDTVSLRKACDLNKDQSYFLHALNQSQLRQAIFPLGDLDKPQVRQIAKDHGLINYAKKDSTGICFIGKRPFKAFLQEYLLAQPGKIKTVTDQTIGQHEGLMFHTLGQRQGLNIGGLKDYPEAPWYVVDKDIASNTLIVAQGQDHPRLFAARLLCQNIHWITGQAPQMPLACHAKIRYRQADQACQVQQINSGQWQVDFTEPQRAITPGQAVVFYQGDICLGGGEINEKF
ncbi:MAG: tRNA 2-thiouridine(34) synthase MnmA [Gammaproteobacteria bacterium]